MKKRILFLCTRNRCRSQMAEAIINHDLGTAFEAFSAGTNPSEVHPFVPVVLAEIGIDHAGARSKHMDEFADIDFDYVISLCDKANASCPVYFGKTRRTHIGFDDPDAAEGTDAERLEVFRRVRDEIRHAVEAYLAQSEDALPE